MIPGKQMRKLGDGKGSLKMEHMIIPDRVLFRWGREMAEEPPTERA